MPKSTAAMMAMANVVDKAMTPAAQATITEEIMTYFLRRPSRSDSLPEMTEEKITQKA
ncbi:hypothetical protein D3C74_485770 [compost metagenome]